MGGHAGAVRAVRPGAEKCGSRYAPIRQQRRRRLCAIWDVGEDDGEKREEVAATTPTPSGRKWMTQN